MTLSKKARLVTIGIPVRNEAENIQELKKVIQDLTLRIEESGIRVEIIINDNVSTDHSLSLLRSWAQEDPHIRLFALETPLTFQASILEMMRNAKGDAFVIFQSDLQDPPELVLKFVELWEDGHQIVAGVIHKRKEGALSRAVRKIFYFLLRKFSDGTFIVGFQDFYLVSKQVYTKLLTLPNEGLFLRGHISSRFSAPVTVPYIRRDRTKGVSNFNFPQKYSLALDGLLLFGTRFVRIVSTVSFLVFFTSTLIIFGFLISYVFGIRPAIRGWASLGVTILVLLSIMGMTTGLILEYLIRIYRVLILDSKKMN